MSTTSSHTSPNDSRRPHVSEAQRTAEAKAAFTAALKAVGTNIDRELQSRANNIHAMDESLTKQEKGLQKDLEKLAKQNDEMQKFVEQSNKKLVGFDELGSLHADLEADLEDIEEMLRMIEEEGTHENRE